MVLEINSNQPFGVQPNLYVSPMPRQVVARPLMFGVVPDSISTSATLDKYASVSAISDMITANPQIKKILDESNIPLRLNINALEDLKKNHLPETKKIAMGIINNLPADFRCAVDTKSIQQATELHDLGKVLIPANILNKRGALTDSEMEIMRKHSQLGYEMLKSTDLDEATIDLVKNHHQNAQKTGYPEVEDNFVSDINLQILSLADMYSALREQRSYKPSLNKNEALAIIHKEVKQGKVNPYVFKALVDYANEIDRKKFQDEMMLKLPDQKQLSEVERDVLVKFNPQRKPRDRELPNSLSA